MACALLFCAALPAAAQNKAPAKTLKTAPGKSAPGKTANPSARQPAPSAAAGKSTARKTPPLPANPVLSAPAAGLGGRAPGSVLKSTSARDRLAAIYHLSAVGGADAQAGLAEHFRTERDAYLRAQITEALGVSPSSAALSLALAAADDDNQAVRRAAAEALGRRAGTPAADRKLRALSADRDERVRLALLRSLSQSRSTAAVSLAGEQLRDAKAGARVRRAAAAALEAMEAEGAGEALTGYAADADPEIKAAAERRSRRPVRARPGRAPAVSGAAGEEKKAGVE